MESFRLLCHRKSRRKHWFATRNSAEIFRSVFFFAFRFCLVFSAKCIRLFDLIWNGNDRKSDDRNSINLWQSATFVIHRVALLLKLKWAEEVIKSWHTVKTSINLLFQHRRSTIRLTWGAQQLSIEMGFTIFFSSSISKKCFFSFYISAEWPRICCSCCSWLVKVRFTMKELILASGVSSMLGHFFYNLIDCIKHDIHTVAWARVGARARKIHCLRSNYAMFSILLCTQNNVK